MSKLRISWRLLATAVVAFAAAASLAACGGSGDQSAGVRTTAGGELGSMTEATLVLDFVPNAVHAGIYRALAAGYYRDHNIDLRVIQPTSTADTLRLINAEKADFGIADGLDVANQIDNGLDIEAFMALVQRPLGGIITLARDDIDSPEQLEGRTVGITGVPSDRAVLETIVEEAGGDPSKVKVVTIGFNGVQNLESGKIAGFVGFWPADGVQVEVDGHPTTTFKLDESGGPEYPGLVVFSTRQHIEQSPALIRAFAAATVAGYQDLLRDPERALADLLAQNRSLDRELTKAQLEAYMPLFQGDAERFGVLDPQSIEALSEWMVKNGLAREPFTPERYGANEYLPAAGDQA